MDTITLGETGRQTSRLGFGGSSIMGALGRRASLAMLEAAFDAGLRHFDTAPMYGYGEAKSCLGEFLRRHPGQCTVTTKYGIPPSPGRPHARLARSIIRPTLQAFPSLKKHLARAVSRTVVQGAPAHHAARSRFTPEQAKTSLDRSLTALKTDRIDVWLLHEVTGDELHDEKLLRFLEDSVCSGTVGTFGVGSDAVSISDLLAHAPRYCRVLQFQWSVLDPRPQVGEAFRIHHRALTDNFRSLHAALVGNLEVCRRWSDRVGRNLSDHDVLASLMLKAALIENPASIILFSSKNPAHIRGNAAISTDQTLTVPAALLYGLVQSERPILP